MKKYYRVEKNGEIAGMSLNATQKGQEFMIEVLRNKGFTVKQITKSEAMQIKRDSESK